MPENQAPDCLHSSSTPVLATAFHGFSSGEGQLWPPWAFPTSLSLSLPPSGNILLFLGQSHWSVLLPKGNICLSPSADPPPFCFVSSALLACAALTETFSSPEAAAGVHNDRGASISQSFASPQQSWPGAHASVSGDENQLSWTHLLSGFPVKSPQPPQAAGMGSGKGIWDGKQARVCPTACRLPRAKAGPISQEWAYACALLCTHTPPGPRCGLWQP